MRQILLASEEPHEWPSLLRDVIADRTAQHRITRFKRIEDRALRRLPLDVERYLAVNVRQRPKVRR